MKEVRPISIETSILPGAHGSALFTRGETQTIATATLGSKAMEARFETLDTLGKCTTPSLLLIPYHLNHYSTRASFKLRIQNHFFHENPHFP